MTKDELASLLVEVYQHGVAAGEHSKHTIHNVYTGRLEKRPHPRQAGSHEQKAREKQQRVMDAFGVTDEPSAIHPATNVCQGCRQPMSECRCAEILAENRNG